MVNEKCRSSHQRCAIIKVFLEILQNSQESTCSRVSFLLKSQASGLAQLFPCEFCEISQNTLLQNPSGRLLLKMKFPDIFQQCRSLAKSQKEGPGTMSHAALKDDVTPWAIFFVSITDISCLAMQQFDDDITWKLLNQLKS